MAQRKIEVFVSSCPLCQEAAEVVRQAVSECGCQVVVHDLSSPACAEQAAKYGVRAVPSIVVDGELVFTGKPTPSQAHALLYRGD